MVGVVVTVPPYADYLPEVAAHPLVVGLRLNTVMPVAEPLEQLLQRLNSLGKPLWVDLKGRQLRVTEAAVPPFTEVRLSHPIDLTTPALAYFSDGEEAAEVVAVDGNRLILADSPRRVVGPGESINILAGDLTVQGSLTGTDRAYLRACRELGLTRVMVSFAQNRADLEEVRALLPEAEMVAKVENVPGLDGLSELAEGARLMAARGDLFVEVGRPHRILSALKRVIAIDPQAIVASRLLNSLAYQPTPTCSDISDIALLLELGYRTLMLGDHLCFRKNSVLSALNLIDGIRQEVLPCKSDWPKSIAA